VYHIEGQFNIFIGDKQRNTFCVFNDIFALRKHFYTHIEDTITVSPDYNFVLQHCDSTSLNKRHLLQHLAQHRFSSPHDSYIEAVTTLKPKSLIQHNTVSEYSLDPFKKRYDYRHTPESDYASIFSESVATCHQDHSVVLELSGGMDSRFLCELLTENTIDTHTVHYGDKFGYEGAIAKWISDACGTSHEHIALDGDMYTQNATRYIRDTGGMDLFTQSFYYTLFDAVRLKHKNTPVVLECGLSLDVYLAGSYRHYPDYFNTQLTTSPDTTFDIGETHDQQHHFVEHFRVFSTLNLRRIIPRQFIEDLYSFYTYSSYFLMDYLYREKHFDIPRYTEMVSPTLKHTLDIPIHQTHFPPTIPISLRPKATTLVKELDALSQEILSTTGQFVSPHYYSSNYDMWLRFNDNWKQLCLSKLGPDSALYNFVPKDHVQRCVDEHLSGKASHFHALIHWITTAIFLEEYDMLIP
jgi:rhodanese-related sulfurtransferase